MVDDGVDFVREEFLGEIGEEVEFIVDIMKFEHIIYFT